MILPLLSEDNPLLRQKSELVTEFDDDLRKLCKTLEDTAIAANGIGLSSVQCGILKQICLISEEGENFITLINPIVLNKSGSQLSGEGCLSFSRDKKCLVKRPTRMEISYQDIKGIDHTLKTKSQLSRVAQHELDHLEGILFTDKDELDDWMKIKLPLLGVDS